LVDIRLKLKYHRHEAGGIETSKVRDISSKVKYHRHEAGGIEKSKDA